MLRLRVIVKRSDVLLDLGGERLFAGVELVFGSVVGFRCMKNGVSKLKRPLQASGVPSETAA